MPEGKREPEQGKSAHWLHRPTLGSVGIIQHYEILKTEHKKKNFKGNSRT